MAGHCYLLPHSCGKKVTHVSIASMVAKPGPPKIGLMKRVTVFPSPESQQQPSARKLRRALSIAIVGSLIASTLAQQSRPGTHAPDRPPGHRSRADRFRPVESVLPVLSTGRESASVTRTYRALSPELKAWLLSFLDSL